MIDFVKSNRGNKRSKYAYYIIIYYIRKMINNDIINAHRILECAIHNVDMWYYKGQITANLCKFLIRKLSSAYSEVIKTWG